MAGSQIERTAYARALEQIAHSSDDEGARRGDPSPFILISSSETRVLGTGDIFLIPIPSVENINTIVGVVQITFAPPDVSRGDLSGDRVLDITAVMAESPDNQLIMEWRQKPDIPHVGNSQFEIMDDGQIVGSLIMFHERDVKIIDLKTEKELTVVDQTDSKPTGIARGGQSHVVCHTARFSQMKDGRYQVESTPIIFDAANDTFIVGSVQIVCDQQRAAALLRQEKHQ